MKLTSVSNHEVPLAGFVSTDALAGCGRILGLGDGDGDGVGTAPDGVWDGTRVWSWGGKVFEGEGSMVWV